MDVAIEPEGLPNVPRPSGRTHLSGRNHLFDLLRLCFATLVILSHAPELTDGNRSRELFTRLTRSPVSFGELAVDGFFLLSGYLIVQSWVRSPVLKDYLWKRCLRIVPGYLVAVILSTLFVGITAAEPHFFGGLFGSLEFFRSIVFLEAPATPHVFPGTSIVLLNGALWTIGYEFRCYLLVAVLGLLLLHRTMRTTRLVYLVLTLLLLFPLYDVSFRANALWRHHLDLPLGYAMYDLRLVPIFFVGCTFFLLRDWLPYRAGIALLATASLVATDVFSPSHLEFALVLCGGYVLFYFGRRPIRSLDWMRYVPDTSYGIYLYGWPVEAYLIWRYQASPWLIFAVAAPICFLLGWLSWHFVERPMLTLKRHPTAELPVA